MVVSLKTLCILSALTRAAYARPAPTDSSEIQRNAPLHRIIDDYLSLADESINAGATPLNPDVLVETYNLKTREGSDEIGVKFVYSGIEDGLEDPASVLESAISQKGVCSELDCQRLFCAGWCDIHHIYEIEELPEVGQVTLLKIPSTNSDIEDFYQAIKDLHEESGTDSFEGSSSAAQSNSFGSGSVIPQAIVAMQVDEVMRKYPDLDGSGLKIGIISDSWSLALDPLTTLQDDIASGDLPSDVVVLKDSPIVANFVDEGRAMAQLVYDIAPGAKMSFYSGFLVGPGFAEAINALVEDGCDVIVDDIRSDVDEPVYQMGPTAIAANEAAEIHSVPYFTVARNLDGYGYESEYKPTACHPSLVPNLELYESCHDFGIDLGFDLGRSAGYVSLGRETVEIGLHWDDNWYSLNGVAPETDLDLIILQANNGTIDAFVGDDLNTENGDAVEGVTVSVTVSSGGDAIAFIAKKKGTKDPNRIRMMGFFEMALYDNKPSTLTGPGNAPSVAAVGAANEEQVIGQIEKWRRSSRGGSPLIFDTDGNRFDEPLVLKQPRFIGPHGSFTTFFKTKSTCKIEPPRFFGTSASAPNVAAVALLMLQAISELKMGGSKSAKKSKGKKNFKIPYDIYEILEDTAGDMYESGFDFDTGHGFVNALAAIEKIKGKASKSVCAVSDYSFPVVSFFDEGDFTPSAMPSAMPSTPIPTV